MNYFDRPTSKELLDVVNFYINDVLKNPKNLNNFKIKISLNILNIVRRENSLRENINDDFLELGRVITGKEEFSVSDISNLIKNDEIKIDDSKLIDFLYRLSKEKIKVDNPKYQN